MQCLFKVYGMQVLSIRHVLVSERSLDGAEHPGELDGCLVNN